MKRRWSFLSGGLIVLFLSIGLQQGWGDEYYKVKPGDSLYRISKSFGVSIPGIKKANHLKGDEIWPNQILLIPTQRGENLPVIPKKDTRKTSKKPSIEKAQERPSELETYVVQKGDSLYLISKKSGVSVEDIKKINHLSSTLLKVGQALKLPSTPMEEPFEEDGDLEDRKEIREESLAEKGPEERQWSVSLGRWNNPDERNLFIKVVKTFLGVPYRLGGSTLKGIDCSAFVKKIYQIFNVDLPRTAREQFYFGKRVKREELEEGDLVFFKTRRVNGTHVGIYVGNNEFVHASSWSKEVKIDSLETSYFNKRFLGGVRIKELGQES